MNDAPLLQTQRQDSELVHRSYNVALKLVPNLVGQMTIKQLTYLEANPRELANAARRALLVSGLEQNLVEAPEPETTTPNLRQTGPTLAEWLKVREELHKFFTGETFTFRDFFALSEEELASTNLMPAFRPAGATNLMAVEWKRRMGVQVFVEDESKGGVMRYKHATGLIVPRLYLINRSVRPDEDTLGKNARSPDGLIAVQNKLWTGLYGWCDADTLHFAVKNEHLDPETFTWFPEDHLPGGGVAYGVWGGGVRLCWDFADYCDPDFGARSAKKVPLIP